MGSGVSRGELLAMIPPALLYAGNADIKYPLSDFHETDIPNSILIDLMLSVPATYTPIVATLRTTANITFVSIEDMTTGIALASTVVHSVELSKVYPLDMHVDGFGWVVFGYSAVDSTVYDYNGEADIDPECLLQLISTAPEIKVSVNGFTKPITNVLRLESLSNVLSLTVEDGVLYLDRDDSALSPDDRVGLTSITGPAGSADSVLLTLDGVLPDADGNIDIDIVGCVPGCASPRDVVIPRHEAGEGNPTELPLDDFLPRIDAEHPCAPSDMDLTAADAGLDPFEGCPDALKIAITDGHGVEIGTLYTVERP